MVTSQYAGWQPCSSAGSWRRDGSRGDPSSVCCPSWEDTEKREPDAWMLVGQEAADRTESEMLEFLTRC